jgi:hypothetical protein
MMLHSQCDHCGVTYWVLRLPAEATKRLGKPMLCSDRFHEVANAQNAHHPFHAVGQTCKRHFGATFLRISSGSASIPSTTLSCRRDVWIQANMTPETAVWTRRMRDAAGKLTPITQRKNQRQQLNHWIIKIKRIN